MDGAVRLTYAGRFMREHGLVQSAADLGLHGHACWTYDDDAELSARRLRSSPTEYVSASA